MAGPRACEAADVDWLEESRPFAFAGLWEQWKPAEGEPLETCTIITTEANDLMAPIHNRMPVILSPTSYEQWLDPTVQQTEPLKALLRPCPSEELLAHPVSRWSTTRDTTPRIVLRRFRFK